MNFQSDSATGLHGVRHTEGRHGLQILQVGVSLSFPTRQCCVYSEARGRENADLSHDGCYEERTVPPGLSRVTCHAARRVMIEIEGPLS